MASKFLLFGTSLFRTTTTHKTLSSNPSFLTSKRFPSFSLHLRRYCSSVAAADTVTDNPQTVTSTQQQHPWPEWVTFVDRLKTRGYLVETSTKDDDSNDISSDATVSSSSSTDSAVYTDINRLRNPCLSFARDGYDVFISLSISDIQAVVEGGCPNLLRKAVNSAKRLRAYAGLDEGDVCGACNLRGSCDRAYKLLKDDETDARTVDIVRILLFHALDSLVISGGEKSSSRELVEASARKLLSELIELSEASPAPPLPTSTRTASALPKPTHKVSLQKEQRVDFSYDKLSQNVEMKRGDWMCPKCDFMNFARNKRCLKCKADGPKRVDVSDVEIKKGDWNCSKCGFMNFAKNKMCLRCQETRPKGRPGEWDCPKCDFLNYGRNAICLKCECARPKKATTEYEEQIWRSPH